MPHVHAWVRVRIRCARDDVSPLGDDSGCRCALFHPSHDIHSSLTQEQTAWEAAQPINELQVNAMSALAFINGVARPAHITTQGDVAPFLQEQMGRFLGRP